MKKITLFLGVFLAVFILFSSATAVPQTKSSVFLDSLEKIEEKKASLLERFPIQTLGLIDLLKRIIEWFIDIIGDLITIVTELIGVVGLVGTLVETIGDLIDAVLDLIDMIKNLFNPDDPELFL